MAKMNRHEYLELLKKDLIDNENYCRDDYDEQAEYDLELSTLKDIPTIEDLILKLIDEGWDASSLMRFLIDPLVEVGDDMRNLPDTIIGCNI